MRYRRKYYRRNSTNVIKMKFQSFMDISTDVDSMKIITISAGGENILKRLPAQFQAYKYFKLGNISAKLVPASTLPVDPTGLAYGVDQKVDPRDQLSPGLMRITNGEDIFENISGLTLTEQENIYNSMMLDPRWYKWMLQKGVKRHGSPRYWQIGQLHQDKWPGAIMNIPQSDGTGGSLEGTASRYLGYDNNSDQLQSVDIVSHSDPRGIFQTGHRGVIGWLPTDGYQKYLECGEEDNAVSQRPLIASPPEIEMFKIILPKAFKTRFYYRLFISETVYFKEPILMGAMEYRPLDVFHYINAGTPIVPKASYPSTLDDSDTGGNYGDD